MSTRGNYCRPDTAAVPVGGTTLAARNGRSRRTRCAAVCAPGILRLMPCAAACALPDPAAGMGDLGRNGAGMAGQPFARIAPCVSFRLPLAPEIADAVTPGGPVGRIRAREWPPARHIESAAAAALRPLLRCCRRGHGVFCAPGLHIAVCHSAPAEVACCYANDAAIAVVQLCQISSIQC
ncbi:hypothetical protein TBLA_0G03300 [Henningerozyma blattae CBS 6284]|uniref:Uncharacterized protein n=1 Tax=Henningerozyma blattae (strain ATCC 34711 / CBS 6284 / DSM 70876 / NBRC 10599 / NRRL Y-10934 / UCD 77-7) TaxID=1071380 RepID=I2H7B5_HENB6|nr:hypothetical protein TBLA_0G03300 [Tetrapisispora blattae CBS 6284]CCH62267.1 hypothetical protein TBLA_0G03300 [Tetrapisispora blattae CBS 6284]